VSGQPPSGAHDHDLGGHVSPWQSRRIGGVWTGLVGSGMSALVSVEVGLRSRRQKATTPRKTPPVPADRRPSGAWKREPGPLYPAGGSANPPGPVRLGLIATPGPWAALRGICGSLRARGAAGKLFWMHRHPLVRLDLDLPARPEPGHRPSRARQPPCLALALPQLSLSRGPADGPLSNLWGWRRRLGTQRRGSPVLIRVVERRPFQQPSHRI